MTTDPELPYWMALAHIGGWKTEKINRLAIAVLDTNKSKLSDFFDLDADDWKGFGLGEEDIRKLQALRTELPNYSFLAESLLDQGYQIVPVNSPYYSQTLKRNLKLNHSPPVLYLKGNNELLQMDSIAIVGSRDASQEALSFTETRAKIAAGNGLVVISGFAQGVDRLALESALKYKGKSIIVLPQGIITFSSGYKEYYQQIYEGDVLVLSTFHPKARWTAQLAMTRNPIIYGLAEEIFVAACQEKSGTWSGAIDGLRKGRTIYVRKPLTDEKNANNLLIAKGAIPIDAGDNVKPAQAAIVREDDKPAYQPSANIEPSPSQLPLL